MEQANNANKANGTENKAQNKQWREGDSIASRSDTMWSVQTNAFRYHLLGKHSANTECEQTFSSAALTVGMGIGSTAWVLTEPLCTLVTLTLTHRRSNMKEETLEACACLRA